MARLIYWRIAVVRAFLQDTSLFAVSILYDDANNIKEAKRGISINVCSHCHNLCYCFYDNFNKST